MNDLNDGSASAFEEIIPASAGQETGRAGHESGRASSRNLATAKEKEEEEYRKVRFFFTEGKYKKSPIWGVLYPCSTMEL